MRDAATELAAMRGEHGRRHVPKGAVRSAMVVVLATVVGDAAHVAQAGKSVLRSALVAETAVEALNVGVLHRFAGLDEVQLHARSSPPRHASSVLET